MTATVHPLTRLQLREAEKHSWFTIEGAGGDLGQWVDGVTQILTDAGVGTPQAWYSSTGEEVNEYVDRGQRLMWRDAFPNDLTFLMFPLDGLDVGRLAIVKLRMGARWFDDIVQNMRRNGTLA